MSKPLSETNPTLVDKAPVIWLNSLHDKEIDLIQSCTVDVAEHRIATDTICELDREVERLKKELESEKAKNSGIALGSFDHGYEIGKDDGLAEGERRAMQRVKEIIFKIHHPNKEGWCVISPAELLKELGLGEEEKK